MQWDEEAGQPLLVTQVLPVCPHDGIGIGLGNDGCRRCRRPGGRGPVRLGRRCRRRRRRWCHVGVRMAWRRPRSPNATGPDRLCPDDHRGGEPPPRDVACCPRHHGLRGVATDRGRLAADGGDAERLGQVTRRPGSRTACEDVHHRYALEGGGEAGCSRERFSGSPLRQLEGRQLERPALALAGRHHYRDALGVHLSRCRTVPRRPQSRPGEQAGSTVQLRRDLDQGTPLSTSTSRGRPRMRSAIWLRRTSDVPPSIVFARERRKAVAR